MEKSNSILERIKSILVVCATTIFILLSVASPQHAQASTTITYYHTDLSGSPVAATDESGNVVWEENYRPYGSRIDNESVAAPNVRWFTGHPQDETGLIYAGARYYDPLIGRFMGVDPEKYQEGNIHNFNSYTYANNNPLTYWDPDGRDAEWAATAANGGSPETRRFVEKYVLPTVVVGGVLLSPIPPAGKGLITKLLEKIIPPEANGPPRYQDLHRGKIPEKWGEGTPASGNGWKWSNGKKDSIRIMEGDPSSEYPWMRERYVQLRKNGNVIGRDGKVISPEKVSKPSHQPEAHVPYKEWLKWRYLFSPN